MFGRTSYLGLPSFGTSSCSSQCDPSYCDGSVSVLLGTDAGVAQRGTQVVGIGGGAAGSNSGTEVVAIGLGAGANNSGDSVVALGTDTAAGNSGAYVSAVGEGAATSNEANQVVALGQNAGSQADVGGLAGRLWKAVTTGETTGSNSNAPVWGQIVSSADGSVLLAGEIYNNFCNAAADGTGRLYVSKDSGSSWNLISNIGYDLSTNAGYGEWSSVATDYSGNNMYAVNQYTDELWKSSNGGSNWDEVAPNSGSSNWRTVACSSNGQTVVLGENDGDNDLYVSRDGGCNWQLQDLSSNEWRTSAVSADGTRILVGETTESNLYIGVLSNNNWTWNAWTGVDPSNAGDPAQGYWQNVAVSATGQYMYAAEDDNGYLWRSKDYGCNWQVIASNGGYRAVACSSNGESVLYGSSICYGEFAGIALSSNYGSNFTTLSGAYSTSLLDPRTLAMDAGGTKFAAAGGDDGPLGGGSLFINPLPSNIVAIGYDAGSNNIGSDAVLIGTSAGASNAGFNSIAIGSNAGVATGEYSINTFFGDGSSFTDGLFPTKSNAISIGTGAGSNGFGVGMIAIGENAGSKTSGGNTVAIGTNAGVCLSGSAMFSTVAIGEGAASECGPITYGLVAIGSNAGRADRTLYGVGADLSFLNGTVSIGNRAGQGNCAASVNIGTGAGVTNSTYNAVSIGSNAGGGNQVEWGYANLGFSTYGAAMSSNGQYMYSVLDGFFLVSNTNYGLSSDWICNVVLNTADWKDIACTGDGQYVVACESDGGGYLWFNSNKGQSNIWHTDGGFQSNTCNTYYGYWRCVTVAQNNSNIIFAGESNGGDGLLWQSTDGGATLTQVAEVGAGNWRSVRTDACGGYVLAVDSYNSNAWVRDPSGNWKSVNELAQAEYEDKLVAEFWACAVSSNGQYMYAAGAYSDFDDGAVWGSSNYGINWNWISRSSNGLPSNTYYRSVACSGDGQVVYAGVGALGDSNQYIYRSTDGGLSWARAGPRGVSSSWAALACDSDTGRQVLAATRWNSAGLWTSTIPDMYDTVAVGSKAGSNSLGALNVFAGSNAGCSNLASDTVFIGANAGRWNAGEYTIGIGHAANCAGQYDNCIAIGHAALGSNGACYSNGEYRSWCNAADSIAIGQHAGENNGVCNTANNLIAIGQYAGYSNQSVNSIYLGSNPVGQTQTQLYNYNNKFLVYGTTSNQNGIATYTDLSNRWFGIGVIPDRALKVQGDAYITGNLTVDGSYPSDRTLKQEIVVTTLGLDFVKSLKPVDYKFIDKPEALRHGLIAQDVQEVAPEIVRTNTTSGKLGLEYIDLIAPLVKAVQELSAEVDDLKAKVARLQA
jgi:hypothetical protein